MRKTQPDDRSFETEIINSSQFKVFTGKYLLYFYYFNNNQKRFFISCLTLSLPTKYCYSNSLKKTNWSLFIDVTKATHTVERELEKDVHAGIKEAKPERGDHMAPTKQHLFKI